MVKKYLLLMMMTILLPSSVLAFNSYTPVLTTLNNDVYNNGMAAYYSGTTYYLKEIMPSCIPSCGGQPSIFTNKISFASTGATSMSGSISGEPGGYHYWMGYNSYPWYATGLIPTIASQRTAYIDKSTRWQFLKDDGTYIMYSVAVPMQTNVSYADGTGMYGAILYFKDYFILIKKSDSTFSIIKPDFNYFQNGFWDGNFLYYQDGVNFEAILPTITSSTGITYQVINSVAKTVPTRIVYPSTHFCASNRCMVASPYGVPVPWTEKVDGRYEWFYMSSSSATGGVVVDQYGNRATMQSEGIPSGKFPVLSGFKFSGVDATNVSHLFTQNFVSAYTFSTGASVFTSDSLGFGVSSFFNNIPSDPFDNYSNYISPFWQGNIVGSYVYMDYGAGNFKYWDSNCKTPGYTTCSYKFNTNDYRCANDAGQFDSNNILCGVASGINIPSYQNTSTGTQVSSGSAVIPMNNYISGATLSTTTVSSLTFTGNIGVGSGSTNPFSSGSDVGFSFGSGFSIKYKDTPYYTGTTVQGGINIDKAICKNMFNANGNFLYSITGGSGSVQITTPGLEIPSTDDGIMTFLYKLTIGNIISVMTPIIFAPVNYVLSAVAVPREGRDYCFFGGKVTMPMKYGFGTDIPQEWKTMQLPLVGSYDGLGYTMDESLLPGGQSWGKVWNCSKIEAYHYCDYLNPDTTCHLHYDAPVACDIAKGNMFGIPGKDTSVDLGDSNGFTILDYMVIMVLFYIGLGMVMKYNDL